MLTLRPTFRSDEPNPGYCIEGIEFATFPPSPSFGQTVLAVAESLPPRSGQEKEEPKASIADLIHPEYNRQSAEWMLWRSAYKGGREFVHMYLSQFSNRESIGDFEKRKRVTPIPAFAKAGVNDIKNQVIHRISQTVRKGGPDSYLSACLGQNNGVDLKGSTMLWFMSTEVLPELLVMKTIAVYVDAPPADVLNLPTDNHPYLYIYRRENIRNWAYNERGQLTQILLRDYVDILEPTTRLPIGTLPRFRFLWLTAENTVGVAFFDHTGQFTSTTILNLPEIPVHIGKLSDSLMADVANHQVALLNMESSDIISSLKAGFALYVEQRDARYQSSHLKQSNLPPEIRSAVSETLESDMRGHDAGAAEIEVGPSHGRFYGAGMNQPEFIAPPMDPLKASMDKQESLKEDIRILLNLSLANLKSSNVSGDAKAIEQEGTEAGFNAIGKELEHLERLIAKSWGQYLGTTTETTIIYPEQYTEQSDDDRITQAGKLTPYASTVPSITYRKAIQERIAAILLEGKVTDKDLQTIIKEIQVSKVPTADSATIAADVEAGLVSTATGSIARGYEPEEAKTAATEHATRLAAIAKAQAPQGDISKINNPASRGVNDLATPGQNQNQNRNQ